MLEKKFGGIIGYVGRFSKEKGPIYAIKTIEYLKKIRPKALFELHMAGDGPEREYMEGYIKKRGLEDVVWIMGLIEPEKVHHFMCSCDVIMVPSLSEAFGLVNLEAMRAGKPIVASNAGGIPEIIEDGRNGLLCGSGDVKCFAEAILKLLENQQLYKSIVNNNLRDYKKYSWEKAIEKYEVFMKKVIQERGKEG